MPLPVPPLAGQTCPEQAWNRFQPRCDINEKNPLFFDSPTRAKTRDKTRKREATTAAAVRELAWASDWAQWESVAAVARR